MKSLMLALSAFGLMSFAHAEDTVGDKMEKAGHDAKRSMSKGAHHAEEAMCAEGDAKCAAKKAKHRGSEAVDYGKDKTKETVDKVGK